MDLNRDTTSRGAWRSILVTGDFRGSDGLLILLFVAFALLPAVPSLDQIIVWPFILLVGIQVLLQGRGAVVFQNKLGSSEIGLLLFIGTAVLSFFWGDAGEIGISDWLRQLIPYLFLLFYFICPRTNSSDGLELYKLFHMSALIFSFVNIGSAIYTEGGSVISHGRITYANFNFVVPLAFISLCLSFFVLPFSNKYLNALLILTNLFVVIGCGYRSQILLALLSFVVAMFVSKRYLLLCAASFAIPAVLFAIASAFDDIALVEETVARFEQISVELGDSSRALERAYAMEAFLASPIIGSGLGTPVPVSVLYSSEAEVFYQLAHDNVRYIHSVWMYLLMNLGLIGLLFYLMIFVRPLFVSLKKFMGYRNSSYSERILFAAGWGIVIMLTFISVEATYRQVQFNFIAAMFLAIIRSIKVDPQS